MISAEDSSNDDPTHKTYRDGEEGLGVIQVETLADGDKTSNKRPNTTNHTTKAGDDGEKQWNMGKANHAQHLVEVSLTIEEAWCQQTR